MRGVGLRSAGSTIFNASDNNHLKLRRIFNRCACSPRSDIRQVDQPSRADRGSRRVRWWRGADGFKCSALSFSAVSYNPQSLCRCVLKIIRSQGRSASRRTLQASSIVFSGCDQNKPHRTLGPCITKNKNLPTRKLLTLFSFPALSTLPRYLAPSRLSNAHPRLPRFFSSGN